MIFFRYPILFLSFILVFSSIVYWIAGHGAIFPLYALNSYTFYDFVHSPLFYVVMPLMSFALFFMVYALAWFLFRLFSFFLHRIL